MDNSLQKSFSFSFSLEEIAELLKIKFFSKKPKEIHLWTFQENLEFSAHNNSYMEDSEILAKFPIIIRIKFPRKTDIWYYPNFTIYWKLSRDQIKLHKFYEGGDGQQGKEKLAHLLTIKNIQDRARIKKALEKDPFVLECKTDETLFRNKDHFLLEARAHYPDLEFDLYKGKLTIKGKGFVLEDTFRLSQKSRIKKASLKELEEKIKASRVLGNLAPDNFTVTLCSPHRKTGGGYAFFGLELVRGADTIPISLDFSQIYDYAQFPQHVAKKIETIKKWIAVLDEIKNYCEVQVRGKADIYRIIKLAIGEKSATQDMASLNLPLDEFLLCLKDIRDRLKGGEDVSNIVQDYS